MKKILYLMIGVLVAVACQKEPSTLDPDNEYLVYTAPAKGMDFQKFKLFYLPDSLLVIGQGSQPYYSESVNAQALIQEFADNMIHYGYLSTTNRAEADLGVQLTYVVHTERFVQYYEHPYWWIDYPGYWNPNFWGDWYGYYYPGPMTYTYSTNALLADMVDLTANPGNGKALNVVWAAYMGGPAGPSLYYDVRRMKESIDQAFKQSTYLDVRQPQTIN